VSRNLVQGVDLKCLAEISDRSFFVALSGVGDAPDGVGDGAVNLALNVVGAAPIVVGGGKFRVELDGLGVVGKDAVGRPLCFLTLPRGKAIGPSNSGCDSEMGAPGRIRRVVLCPPPGCFGEAARKK
jgi:hypothetical protein